MKIKLLYALLITLFLYSCQDKTTNTTGTTTNQYAGKWKFTVYTADSSSDTVTIATDGSFTVNNITLFPDTGMSYIASATGNVDNSASFNAHVTYSNVTFPFATTISGFTGANGNYMITISYNSIQIGSADGSISNTYFTGSGNFTTPVFSGQWAVAKVN